MDILTPKLSEDLRKVLFFSSLWFTENMKFYVTNTINPFHTTGFFLYPQKTSENQKFYVFRGYRKTPVG